MKVRQVFSLGILTLATGAVLAATPLMNGEGSTRGDQGSEGPSQTTRAAVKAGVAQARADGTLVGPGSKTPGDVVYARLAAAPSTETRAEVKAEVREARADGTLIPAGEGGSALEGRLAVNPIDAKAHTDASERVASSHSK